VIGPHVRDNYSVFSGAPRDYDSSVGNTTRGEGERSRDLIHDRTHTRIGMAKGENKTNQ